MSLSRVFKLRICRGVTTDSADPSLWAYGAQNSGIFSLKILQTTFRVDVRFNE